MKQHQASEEMLEWAINGSALHVPALWTWEILNAVGVVIRRRRISPDRGQTFLQQLAALNFKIDRPPLISDFPRLHSLAAAHQLTVTMPPILIWRSACHFRSQRAMMT